MRRMGCAWPVQEEMGDMPVSSYHSDRSLILIRSFFFWYVLRSFYYHYYHHDYYDFHNCGCPGDGSTSP